MGKEKCVIDGRDIDEDFQSPIKERTFCVEGVGQLCRQCYAEAYGTRK